MILCVCRKDLVVCLRSGAFAALEPFSPWQRLSKVKHVSCFYSFNVEAILGALGKKAEIQQVFFFPTWPDIFQRRLHALFSSRKDKFAMRLFKLSLKRIETRALQEM